MGNINSKQKGKRGEIELASKLREHGYDVRRSVQYSGKAEDGQADLVGLPGIHVECKRTEVLKAYDFIAQAKRDAKNNQMPAVFHRRNDCEWLVILTLEDFMKLYKGEVEDDKECT